MKKSLQFVTSRQKMKNEVLYLQQVAKYFDNF